MGPKMLSTFLSSQYCSNFLKCSVHTLCHVVPDFPNMTLLRPTLCAGSYTFGCKKVGES